MTRHVIAGLSVAAMALLPAATASAHQGQAGRGAAAQECSADALPASERRAMEARFRQIDRSEGRAAATAYVEEQGRLFRERLIASGVCPADETTTSERASTSDEPGDGCRLEVRPVAGLGGGAMTMTMVTVCD